MSKMSKLTALGEGVYIIGADGEIEFSHEVYLVGGDSENVGEFPEALVHVSGPLARVSCSDCSFGWECPNDNQVYWSLSDLREFAGKVRGCPRCGLQQVFPTQLAAKNLSRYVAENTRIVKASVIKSLSFFLVECGKCKQEIECPYDGGYVWSPKDVWQASCAPVMCYGCSTLNLLPNLLDDLMVEVCE